MKSSLLVLAAAALLFSVSNASAGGVYCECDEDCAVQLIPPGPATLPGHHIVCCNNIDLSMPSAPSGAAAACGSISIGAIALLGGCFNATTQSGCIDGETVGSGGLTSCGDSAAEACEACGCSNSSACLAGPC